MNGPFIIFHLSILGLPLIFRYCSLLLQAKRNLAEGAPFPQCAVQVKIKNLCKITEIYYVNA